jgi:LysM repeat protein
LEGYEGLRTETKVFVSPADDLDNLVAKINEFLKKTNASVSYHNVESKDFTYVIATATGIP